MENVWPYVMKMGGSELKITFILESESDVLQQMLPDIPTAAKNVTYLKIGKIFKHNYFCADFYLFVHMFYLCLIAVDETWNVRELFFFVWNPGDKGTPGVDYSSLISKMFNVDWETN